ncbi:hypothetical protein A2960_00110 [Candidatus Gottesmanbacteria bacterium RIFCSPLOWO2_01_FULL_39_12b]|uniref:Uncharacterized protein n=1 Tax=Candidatus Gottesmanbacteria bacterium RIFCSPLOWO2_01_FULL_39_12b TaxID=1798388 RepID=A0A1F6ARQ0_9BACT|nr:MAG: hypothetical protein A2960_00110 [Candidatus Gottesmanbacteria bacterium RIFCSPLOWO2_01_FULL_39_12b]
MKIKLHILRMIAVSLLLLLIGPVKVEAAKKFIPKSAGTKNYTRTSPIPASVRYRGDKNGILFSFLNFNGLESVSYSFTYSTNGIQQGAAGNITKANNPLLTRELLFGTCSGGVCRYHSNLANARLTLNARFTNGNTRTKVYKIRTYK